MTINSVRTRFAPSPTGYIHLGNIRTALYSWLFARHHHGEFVLRIEDTDRERSTKEAVQIILDSMQWLNLDYDEGPIYQTDRLAHYREVAEDLIKKGLAYRCYCSKERIEALREKQLAAKEKPRYDGCCRDKNLPARDDTPYVIRFKNPQIGTIDFVDEVRGAVSYQNEELDDLIIIRTDGYPTYNFSVVIDDLEMRITHVIRGAGHINNTPRQINIFKALGATPPIFGHVPLILGNDGKLLSKRHGAVNVLEYRDAGYLPEAMLNYLIRLGWSHGDQEIFSRTDMIKLFTLDKINKAAAAFDMEKLKWLNRHYIKSLDLDITAKQLQSQMQKLNINTQNGPENTQIVLALRERADTLEEMAEKSRIYYEDIPAYANSAKEHLNATILPILNTLKNKLAALSNWTKENIHQEIAATAEECSLKLGKIAQPLRVAVTGGTFSPPIDITLVLIGKEKTLMRLEKAINFCKLP